MKVIHENGSTTNTAAAAVIREDILSNDQYFDTQGEGYGAVPRAFVQARLPMPLAGNATDWPIGLCRRDKAKARVERMFAFRKATAKKTEEKVKAREEKKEFKKAVQPSEPGFFSRMGSKVSDLTPSILRRKAKEAAQPEVKVEPQTSATVTELKPVQAVEPVVVVAMPAEGVFVEKAADVQQAPAPAVADGGGFAGVSDGDHGERETIVIVREGVAVPLASVAEMAGDLNLDLASLDGASMADTMNAKFVDGFFEARFESIRQTFPFNPAWAASENVIDAMSRDEELTALLGTGYQMKCVDTEGRKVIATGTQCGSVFVYEADVEGSGYRVVAPQALRLSGMVISDNGRIAASDLEAVLGSVDNKTTVNVGKKLAAVVRSLQKKA